MKIKKISREEEIYNIMMFCKDSFFSDFVKNQKIIFEMSNKFAANAEFYTAFDGDLPLGFIAFYCNDLESRTAFISMIIVCNNSQGLGVGSKLLNNSITACKKQNFEAIKLEVDKKNKKAIDFYEKKGFKRIKQANELSWFYQLDL